MVTAELYIEGGGDNRQQHSKALRIRFRQSWNAFFKSAGLGGRMPKVVQGGGRQQTFERFAIAVAKRHPGIVSLLLVESEAPVAVGHSVWQHLQANDNWIRPLNAGDDQAFLMVQVMETWFLADRNSLQRYFGAKFNENAFRQWPQLEAVPKETVFDALERATDKGYAKGKVSFELLAQIDPARVETACPHAKAFLNRLRMLCL